MKTLLLLLISATCYSQDTICIDRLKYKALLVRLADANLLAKDNEFLKKDTAALHKEVNRKETVILRIQQQRNTYKSLDSLCQLRASNSEDIISKQLNSIKRLQPKKWALGLIGGYGIGQTLKPGAFVGIGLTKTFLRF